MAADGPTIVCSIVSRPRQRLFHSGNSEIRNMGRSDAGAGITKRQHQRKMKSSLIVSFV